ncbi:MAG: MFS transporter [Myxococcota bacterium]
MLGTSSWFLAFGIHAVLFSWLVTIVLRESPQMVGVAQMSMLVPATLLMLVGGSLADHFGGRRIAVLAQSFAVAPPVALAVLVATGSLRIGAMLGYAVAMGLAQAFLTPARDALLNDVAEAGIQRTVVRASLVQFGAQIAGFLAASRADALGPLPIFALQIAALGVGAFALARVRVDPHPVAEGTHWLRDMATSVAEGARTVFASREMRLVVLQNAAMGACFMGSYIVTVPLLIRELYKGSASDLGLVNAANSLGLLTTVLALMRFGDVRRRFRALLLSQAVGACILALIGAGLGFAATLALICVWGMCGGLAMSMARTIMQEQAPPGQAGRVMAFFSFSLLGAGPLGALACGYLVTWLGPQRALVVAALVMGVVVSAVCAWSLARRRDDRHLAATGYAHGDYRERARRRAGE